VQGLSVSIILGLQCGRAGRTFIINTGMKDFPASDEPGTGMNKTTDAGTSPVPG
jgi:hypothetical protein